MEGLTVVLDPLLTHPLGIGIVFLMDLCISCYFLQLWFRWQKSPSPPPLAKQEKHFSGSMHFMKFPASMVQVAEKPPPPSPPLSKQGKFILVYLWISWNFLQFWFRWQKSLPPSAKQAKHFSCQKMPLQRKKIDDYHVLTCWVLGSTHFSMCIIGVFHGDKVCTGLRWLAPISYYKWAHCHKITT